jgi:hypothetical protein
MPLKIMKNIITIVCLLFCLSCDAQKKYDFTKQFAISTDNMKNESPSFILVHIKTDRKGRIDSFSFLNLEYTKFAQNIKNSLTDLKLKKQKFSTNNLVLFFVFLNEDKNTEPTFFYHALDGYKKEVWEQFKNESCEFSGPIIITPSTR